MRCDYMKLTLRLVGSAMGFMVTTLIFAIPSDPGHYSNNLLLDDVGNCISCTDETLDSSNFERRGMKFLAEIHI
ncbi:hypothetical protein SAY86_006788 [Trapa natans]|uniref:Uncharacterized protein n=1 Tax=Trapa natans TaxID=22666 RepID=A0AAN7LCS6_TRANT|nr:hypothetical protein SAY86_006788 [Trapa natans]